MPLATLGFHPQQGKSYKLDLVVIYSDATGTTRSLRMYWANKATGLVNDIPGEIMLHPGLWGDGAFESSNACPFPLKRNPGYLLPPPAHRGGSWRARMWRRGGPPSGGRRLRNLSW